MVQMPVNVKQMPEDEEYDRLTDEHTSELHDLVEKLFAGAITFAVFRVLFSQKVRDQMTAMFVLGLAGAAATEQQLAELERRLAERLVFLDGFLADLQAGTISKERALWRGGLYGFSRGLYVFSSLPVEVALLMPVMPGDDCLGGNLCHCSLRVDRVSDEEVHVYWELDPTSESCSVCIAHAVESPFIFRLD